jgi:hypothetical protein
MRVTVQRLPPSHNAACSAHGHGAVDEDAFALTRAANALSVCATQPCQTWRRSFFGQLSVGEPRSSPHTIYECSSCDVRYLGERRCSECNHFCRALGLGGACQDCEQPILLSDLLDLDV